MFQFLHSSWAYLTLLTLLVAVINALIKKLSDKPFSSKDFRICLFALITTHIQFLLGFIAYFSSTWFEMRGTEGAMGDKTIRLFLLEHPLINIIAIVLITIGWSRHKKETSGKAKFSKIALFYGIGLILILSRIPWKIWFS